MLKASCELACVETVELVPSSTGRSPTGPLQISSVRTAIGNTGPAESLSLEDRHHLDPGYFPIPHLVRRDAAWVGRSGRSNQGIASSKHGLTPQVFVLRNVHLSDSSGTSMHLALAVFSMMPSTRSGSPLNRGLFTMVSSRLVRCRLHISSLCLTVKITALVGPHRLYLTVVMNATQEVFEYLACVRFLLEDLDSSIPVNVIMSNHAGMAIAE